jgi:uncharacterized protein
MNLRRILVLVAFVLAPFGGHAQQTQSPQARLPTITLQVGMHRITAEVADTVETRSKGLMYRKHMAAHEGMLFVFQRKEAQCFWMRNTPLPLTIAFLDDDGTVVNLADMKALDETSHCAAKPVQFALEVNQGWFAKKGLKAGVKIGGLK